MTTSRRLTALSFPCLVNLLPLLLFLPTATAQLECQNYAPPAVMKGNKIFLSTTGEYLPIKGINYYPRPNAGDLTLGNSQDFYTEEFRASWERDIAQFKALHVNAIRLYAVDPGLNHDAFMCALKAVGIYAIVGLAADCQDCAVQWQDPPTCYPLTLKTRGEFIISQFAKYENVLGFSAGNEISLSADSYLGNLPCQKKFLRDMRAYVQDCMASAGMRHIPVGIIFADHERAVKAQYYNCQSSSDDDLEMAEFVGVNAYLHCDGGATSFDQLTGYQMLLQDFASYKMTIPVLWTEFGCLNESFETMGDNQAQRNFLQVEALYSPAFQDEFNGGFVFEYSTEKVYSEQSSPYPFTSFGAGNYGVGYFAPENCNHVDIPCDYVPFPQFQTLANRYAAVDTSSSGVTLQDYSPPARNPPACPIEVPPLDAFEWPTDAVVQEQRATRQCPVLVPVYCDGVPGECAAAPSLPGDGSSTTTTAPTAATPGVTDPPTSGPTIASSTNTPSVSPISLSNAPTNVTTDIPSASPTTSSSSGSTKEEPTSAPSEAPTLNFLLIDNNAASSAAVRGMQPRCCGRAWLVAILFMAGSSLAVLLL